MRTDLITRTRVAGRVAPPGHPQATAGRRATRNHFGITSELLQAREGGAHLVSSTVLVSQAR